MSDRSLGQAGRVRLGGRGRILWQAYAITAPIAVVVLVAGTTRSWSDIPLWFVIGVIAAIITGGWMTLAHRLFMQGRPTESSPLLPMTVNTAIAIAVFVAIAAALGVAFGVPVGDGPMVRVVPTIIAGTLWTIVIVRMLEARWRFGEERDVLVERAVQQQLATLQEAEVVDRIRESLRGEIVDHLTEVRAGIEDHLASTSRDSGGIESVAAELREAAQHAVRPLSHELAARTERAYPRPGIRSVLRNIVERQPFRPLAVSIVYVVTTAPREIEEGGWFAGLAVVAVTIALIFATMGAANWSMRRWPTHHAALFFAGIVVIQAPSLLLPPVYAGITGTAVDWAEQFVSVGFGVLIIVVTSGFGSLRASREDLLRTFETEVNDDEIAMLARSRVLAEAARDAAQVLHGPIQTKLVACAMAIDHAALIGDVVGVNQALVQARAILEQPLPELRTSVDVRVDEQVERKAALWRGLVDVTVDVDPNVADLNGQLADDVGAVIEEGVANAIQHGSATRVDIEIGRVNDELVIHITDNGAGLMTGAPGLGTRLLDQVASGWRLEAHDEGACLTVTMPISGRSNAPSAANMWV